MKDEVKGTATSLASLYRAEEARKAAKLVEDKISEKQKELENLNLFISENNSLLKLVQRLPDELFHNVMVPFGKAAFFPGRLIHTNEFLVLLGEGYYAERTSRQTVEILQRRGKVLESQVDSFKAMMEDLKAEASFFLETATEAEEGLMEIREDYIEEAPIERFSKQTVESQGSSEDASIRVDVEDEEFARIMAQMDELERQELASGSVDDGDEEHDIDWSLKIMELEDSNPRIKQVSKGQLLKEKPSHGKDEALNMDKSNIVEKPKLCPEAKEKYPGATPKAADPVSNKYPGAMPKATDPVSNKYPGAMPKATDPVSNKYIIPSIVERINNIETNPANQSSVSSQATASNPSKPVSRFKMQRQIR